MTTYLYRYFDADDRLLYVGVSTNWIARDLQHKASKDWYHQIVSSKIAKYDTREAALTAEMEAIVAEAPLHNRLGNRHWVDKRAQQSPAREPRQIDPNVVRSRMNRLIIDVRNATLARRLRQQGEA